MQWIATPRGEMMIDRLFDLVISVTKTTVGENFIARFFDIDGNMTNIDPVIGRSAEEVKARVQQKIAENTFRGIFGL
jgi:hypothetical protein